MNTLCRLRINNLHEVSCAQWFISVQLSSRELVPQLVPQVPAWRMFEQDSPTRFFAI
jgi:hypothetical protein